VTYHNLAENNVTTNAVAYTVFLALYY